MSDTDMSNSRFAWLRSGFDLEGYVGALAAILIGLFLSMFWGPLFLLGLTGAVMALLATRTARRTPPLGEGLIVAPTDGIIVSIETAAPPAELRLPDGDWRRIRVSIAPCHSSGVHASMDGALGHIIRETGDSAAFAALRADRPGLAVLYYTLVSGTDLLGVRLATGGLGPRLDMEFESEDAVRLGRVIGTLRFGGWCDIYLPAELAIQPRIGQSLIGSETILAHWPASCEKSPLSDIVDTAADAVSAQNPDTAPAPSQSVPSDIAQTDAEDTLTLEKIAGAIKEADASPISDKTDEDVSEMFERLRREVRKSDTDDASG